MTRDNVVFTGFGLLLGLVIGSMVIGPKLAQSKLAGAPAAVVAPAERGAGSPTRAAGSEEPAPGSPMGAVFQKINNLKQQIERDPNNAEALAQLGTMYMDAGKFPQAS